MNEKQMLKRNFYHKKSCFTTKMLITVMNAIEKNSIIWENIFLLALKGIIFSILTKSFRKITLLTVLWVTEVDSGN
ncbi:Beta-hexosaminidase subunit beta [Dirofilaria immitis]